MAADGKRVNLRGIEWVDVGGCRRVRVAMPEGAAEDREPEGDMSPLINLSDAYRAHLATAHVASLNTH